jgi:alkanesulfonate monooxygenase SsuD/methylene tetrahydromethanopterin reductase-like flavin-dependent oxidoreductase (luciferase family)
MPKPKNPPVAGSDEDPNVELQPYASPPCYAHEVEPAYFGLSCDEREAGSTQSASSGTMPPENRPTRRKRPMTTAPITFAFQAAPTSEDPVPDQRLYKEVVEDCQLGAELGYEAAWFLEHHFSDYYPTPSPLVFMAHVAAECPTLGLGTSVLVIPWYHPLRLAEEISMVNALTEGTLHIGMGRGTAKMEYDAYGVDMNEARARFAETWKIVETAMTGEPFTFDGKFNKIGREIRLRPTPTGKPVKFYGAIGSPGSAGIMAELGLPPLCLAQFPDHLLERIVGTWRRKSEEAGKPTEATIPIAAKLFIAKTDEEARDLARTYLPRNFEAQVKHYEIDANPWEDIPEYEVFSKIFSNMKQMTDPANLGPIMDLNLVGNAKTIARRIEALARLGFNYVMVSSATPGVPKQVRREMYRRFAGEVAPRFDTAFGRRTERLVAAGND